MGKTTIEIDFFTIGKKLTLINVLHVHDVRTNLVFANFLCKGGFKTISEAENLIFSKNGIFIWKRYACDGMFKVSVTSIINNIKNVSAYMIDSSITL